MSGEKQLVIAGLSALQTAVNGVDAGAQKDAVQAALNTLVTRMVRAQLVGEIRVGKEIPAAA